MKTEKITVNNDIIYTDWYKDFRTCAVMLHLLFKTAFEPDYRRRTLAWNQVSVSLQYLADETGLSFEQVRKATEKLIYMGELEKTIYSQNAVYTIVNYDEYVKAVFKDEKQA